MLTIHVAPLPDLPLEVHTVLLVGRKTSDHLRELIRIAEFRGRIAYRIESAAQLQPRWFSGETAVGVVVGAEEMEEIVAQVLERLRSFSSSQTGDMLEGVARSHGGAL